MFPKRLYENLMMKKIKNQWFTIKNAAWESWLDKNNGIETDHKEGEEDKT